MIGTDSHTPNAGGLGMIACGVGGADAVDVMADIPWELKAPKVIGVELKGKLSGWTTPKDVILKVAGELTVKGGTGAIIEYKGAGVESLSCTGMATICNMGAEIGATTSVFPYNERMGDYPARPPTDPRSPTSPRLPAQPPPDSGAEYDSHIEINLDTLEPHINGPFTPDLATPLSKFAEEVKKNDWPEELKVSLIGSCTNSSYEDMSRSASIAEEAAAHGPQGQVAVHHHPRFRADPCHHRARRPDGGPREGRRYGACQRLRPLHRPVGTARTSRRVTRTRSSPRTTVTSPAVTTPNPATHAFVASPDLVTAMAFAGPPHLQPHDRQPQGRRWQGVQVHRPQRQGAASPRLRPPATTPTKTPPRTARRCRSPSTPSRTVCRSSSPSSPGTARTPTDCPVLIKAKGKCTTDHISAGGPWLKYRGHLENISNNCLIGAINAANGKANEVQNVFSGEWGPVPATAIQYREQGKPWVVIGDENYGEGSSREHPPLSSPVSSSVAAPSLRARLPVSTRPTCASRACSPLRFANPADYDKVPLGRPCRHHRRHRARRGLQGLARLQAQGRLQGRAAAHPHHERQPDLVVQARARPSTRWPPPPSRPKRACGRPCRCHGRCDTARSCTRLALLLVQSVLVQKPSLVCARR
ncbi:hypothetical protein L1887_58833 [Cichorium endivia]|nr:hypothetical protein L1887_58833 [Cichorium endivia]